MQLEDKFYPMKGYEETHLINPITQEVYSKIKNKILKGSIHTGKKGGYKGINIKTDGYKKAKWIPIHRIMALTFIPNPNNYPVVNHINGDKLMVASLDGHRISIRKITLRDNYEQRKND